MSSPDPAPNAAKIALYPNTASSTLTSQNLIFFVTGNPGYISYYKTFLSTLFDLLSSPTELTNPPSFYVYGQSLAGFEENDSPPQATSLPYTLEDQISISLQALTHQTIPSGPRKGEPFDNVIFIGHSVGTYIVLEVLARLQKSASPVKPKGAILLFPTVTHIEQSPNGLKFGSLIKTPGFSRGLAASAKMLLWPLPKPVLKWLIGLITGFPSDSAEVTSRLFTSKMGLWQALHLAKDEMESITDDKWEEEIWGIEQETPESQRDIPKLVFYFGENDNWVANHTRDVLIAARGKGKEDGSSSKPLMLIDKNDIPHSFCIRHSERIAEMVKVWIEDILAAKA